MQGSVFKRGNTYSVIIDQGRDPNGKRKQQWHSGYRTKREAEHACTELLHGLQTGTYVAPSKTTVGEFLIKWLDYARTTVSVKTFVRYEEVVKVRLIPELGSIPLSKLKPEHIVSAYARWANIRYRGRLLSAQTLLHFHRILHRALDRAVKWQELAANPVAAVDPPRVPRHQITPLDIEQSKALLAVTASDKEYGPVVALTLLTGMRIGEVTGLRWEDIDFRRNTISVRRSVQHINGYGLLIKEPKTGHGRTVAVSDQAIAVLDSIDRHYEYVFSLDGNPLNGNAVRRHFRDLLTLAHLPMVRFHDLRHTHATLLLAQDVHPKVVSERLGHARIAITLDTYSHVLPNLQQDAVQRLDSLLST